MIVTIILADDLEMTIVEVRKSRIGSKIRGRRLLQTYSQCCTVQAASVHRRTI